MIEYITLTDGRNVLTKDYIKAKTLDLHSYYPDLTQKTVCEELEHLLNNEPVSVIGEFMRGDIEANS